MLLEGEVKDHLTPIPSPLQLRAGAVESQLGGGPLGNDRAIDQLRGALEPIAGLADLCQTGDRIRPIVLGNGHLHHLPEIGVAGVSGYQVHNVQLSLHRLALALTIEYVEWCWCGALNVEVVVTHRRAIRA